MSEGKRLKKGDKYDPTTKHEEEFKSDLTQASDGNGTYPTEEKPVADITKAATVVGVGASAGGLAALDAFFNDMPGNTGLSFVIVQHLSPDFRSMMGDLLSRRTDMPVRTAEHNMQVAPNEVYLIPPKKEMRLFESRLLLSDKLESPEPSLPIDTFFRSLARELGEMAVGIVLSGTGSDGSRGIQAIREAGGVSIVQDPESAQFDGMPRAAIDTGCVDLINRPEQMGKALSRLSRGVKPIASPQQINRKKDPLNNLFELLYHRYGIDFGAYRKSTISRRIERRVEFIRGLNLADYIKRLETDEAELEALYHDLLIGVTRFFRDPEAFEQLAKHAIPEIFERREDAREIRVWAAACATGEEAYTLAILFDEEAQRRGWLGEVKIFATDVHVPSLEFAGAGSYTRHQVHSVDAARLDRYFERNGDNYTVKPRLRRSVVFATHNLLRDAPFTNIDLVTCRNVMIYLELEAQRKVLSLLHYSLCPNGILMLGPSETPGELEFEFKPVDNRWRVFRKKRDVSLLNDVRPVRSTQQATPSPPPSSSGRPTPQRLLERQVIAAYEQLAKSYLPPTFVVSEAGELVYSTTGAGEFLSRKEGFHQNNLLELVDRELRTALAGLLKRVVRENSSLTYNSVAFGPPDNRIVADVTVAPVDLPSLPNQCFMVTIANHSPSVADITRSESHNSAEMGQRLLRETESELERTRDHLQSTVEELEASNEELQASNEELIASNEELQSTNEELQSVNEEMYSVSVEHQRKIDELTELTEDMENLLRSTDAATLFLDHKLRLRKFSPGVKRVFRIVKSDVGRELSSFTHMLQYDELFSDLHRVLSEEISVEKEVADSEGTHFIVKMIPYQSSVETKGVIVSLVDLSSVINARLKIEESERRFRGTFENAAVGIAHVALDGTWLDVNQRLCDIVGYTREELLQLRFQDITHGEEVDADVEQLNSLIRGEVDRYSMQKRYIRKNGQDVWINLTVSLQRDTAGEPMFCISIVQDITPRKRFEGQLKNAVRQRDQFLADFIPRTTKPALGSVARCAID